MMSSVKSKGNATTELPLVSSMRSLGISGWKRHRKIGIPSGHVKPDFVFPKERLAVFVSGCFWHMCPRHCSIPKSNVEFWEAKLLANKSRDNRNNRELKSIGWDVLTIWEHSVRKNPVRCAEMVLERLVWRVP